MARRTKLAAVLAASLSARAVSECDLKFGDMRVNLATVGQTALRLRLLPEGTTAFANPMVAETTQHAAFVQEMEGCEAGTQQEASVQGPGCACSGITSPVGSLHVSQKGVVILKDRRGRVLTTSEPIIGGGKLVLSSGEASLYGRGAAPPDAAELTSEFAQPKVYNRATYTPYYWSPSDKYGALGAVPVNRHTGPEMALNYTKEEGRITWWYRGGPFEVHFMPSETLEKGTESFYELIGRPEVPPRYMFGFGASRWGWENRSYIEGVLEQFRARRFPLDYIIIDFEWFMTETDYSYDENGKATYKDFGWNPALFDEPAKQLQKYRSDYHVRMAGIRKPRIGNANDLVQLRESGWILPNGEPAGTYPPSGHYADGRSLDYSMADVRGWYADRMMHYTTQGVGGVDFWWNDEGEANYYTFWFWNVAERDAVHRVDPAKRFFSLNRAWSPGMARIGAAVWTGDVNADWTDLADTPGMMLNWVLGGAPYVGCDIGGFNGETNGEHLTRWMQLGVFMPVMRVHSVISATPHFPWNFGLEAAAVMRDALDLRYRLVPYHYSLAHRLYETYSNWIRPLAMEFPDDAAAGGIVREWMDGDILVAPVVRADSVKKIYLPKGTQWFSFAAGSGQSALYKGGTRIEGPAGLEEIPAFVRQGAVVPMAGLVQHTDDLAGGTLHVEVYGGSDGAFDLVEDDSETMAYAKGARRVTSLRWDQDAHEFTWAVTGDFPGSATKGFTKMEVTLFEPCPGGRIKIYTSGIHDLAKGGLLELGGGEGAIAK